MATSTLSMLPEEMEMEVLLRLPVKSILRFSAVCRRWAARLSSEEFRVAWGKLADSTAMEPAAQLLFLPLTPWIYERSTKVRCGDGRPLLTLDGVYDHSAVMAPAPCRGITLLHDTSTGRYHVFNATTRAAATLPPPPSCQDGTLTQLFVSTAGLGFDERSKEHKMVRLVCSAEPEVPAEDMFSGIRCEVHTLGRGPDRRWRPPTSADADGFVLPSTLASSALFAAMMSNPAPVFADGFLHWLVDPDFENPAAGAGASRSVPPVLSFSLADETFSRWVRPPPFRWHVREAHLAELDGRLCMVRDLRRGSSGQLEIWSYGAAADGGGDFWSLEHRIDLAHLVGRDLLTEPRHIRVLGFSAGKRVILVATTKGNVVAYDPTSGTLETVIQIGGGRTTHDETQDRQNLARFSLFKESLTPVY